MMNRLGLVGRLGRQLVAPGRRSLYTDGLYPYPLKYVTEKVHPATHLYRETWEYPEYQASNDRIAMWMQRFFWTWIFWNFMHHPEVLTGHFHPPDPRDWTDEELGIPPLEEGSYEDWLSKRQESG